MFLTETCKNPIICIILYWIIVIGAEAAAGKHAAQFNDFFSTCRITKVYSAHAQHMIILVSWFDVSQQK